MPCDKIHDGQKMNANVLQFIILNNAEQLP